MFRLQRQTITINMDQYMQSFADKSENIKQFSPVKTYAGESNAK